MKRLKNTAVIFLVLITALLPCQMSAFAVSKDTAVSKVIMVAEDEVGYTGTRTYSKYGEWYGYQGGWCSTFAFWCFNKAGNSLGVKLYGNIVPGGGNCSSMLSWFSNKGRYHKRSSGYTPQKGDLVFFNWNGGQNAQHVGIVKSVSASRIYTIEGNCSGKVKERSYSPSGSKPYASTGSILGYGNPNWSAVSSGSSSVKRKKSSSTSKTARTSKKRTVSSAKSNRKSNKKAASVLTTAKKSSSSGSVSKTKSSKTSSAKSQSSVTTKTATKATTKAAIKATDMTIHAATNSIQVGDSVKLDYEIKPASSSAAVGYFCDEDDIVSVSDTGVITGKKKGTATVVVCANDEIYRQCDFTVTSPNSQVTTKSADQISTIPYIGADKADSKEQKLSKIGINADKLISHRRYFAVPLCIIGATAVTVLCIEAVKAAVKSVKKRKAKKESEN